ncbi:MAG: sigma-70 family RNA polymerase sigma factor [Planctomycetales bacterium]|nr:sigma-70 family RNA polymerase sigma factor [Planctomycetales bacterium]
MNSHTNHPVSRTTSASSREENSREEDSLENNARDWAFATSSEEPIDEVLAGKLREAREGDGGQLGELLQQYRNYLSVLATSQIDRRLLPRVSPSDVVQETMLKAHKHFAQFRGGSEMEFRAWLRQILVNNLANFVEKHMIAARRDMRREVSIERLAASLEKSTVRLASLLPAPNATPSMAAQHREEALLLADRMAQLSESYREVLVLRNLQGLSFEEIAQQTNRSVGASRMLWLRAIEKLRSIYRNDAHGPT